MRNVRRRSTRLLQMATGPGHLTGGIVGGVRTHVNSSQPTGLLLALTQTSPKREGQPMGLLLSLAYVGSPRLAGGIFRPTYLLRDDFTTTAAAPLASPRTAEPGPGTGTITDTNSKFSVSGAKFVSAGAEAGNDGIRYGILARSAGRALVGQINMVNTNSRVELGWDTNAAGTAAYSIRLTAGGVLEIDGSTNVGAYSSATDYSVVGVMRSSGMFWFIKGGAFTNWTLLYVNILGSEDCYPELVVVTASGGFTSEYIRALPLPAPFSADFGLASQRIASPIANDTIVSEANAVIEHTWTAVTGETLELSVRRTDDDNRWIIRGDQAGSTVKLIEEVAGVETERATAAQTWTNGTGYRLFVVQDGNTIRGYVANVLKWTYSSASFNNTATGVKVNKAGTDLVSWPRQLGAAAAAILDTSVA